MLLRIVQSISLKNSSDEAVSSLVLTNRGCQAGFSLHMRPSAPVICPEDPDGDAYGGD